MSCSNIMQSIAHSPTVVASCLYPPLG